MANLTSTRRSFVSAALGFGCAGRFALSSAAPFRLGITDWNLHLTADPESIPAAAKLGFAGVQVSFGRKLTDGKMPADRPEIIAQYLAQSRQNNLPINGTCVDRLHDNGLKSDSQAAKWVRDSIRLTQQLNAKVLLLPFFGRQALKTGTEMDDVGDALRDLAPEAAKAGVILGIEDTISAEDNIRIKDRSRAENVLVYYDVGNSTIAGFDPVKEIRWLGRDRICQFHFKDNPHYLGEGKIQLKPIVQAVKDIGWDGWINLETDAHPGSLDADLRRNLAYVRNVVNEVYA